ncbi:glycosyltransferase [Cohnella cholangitidis]|uniref:Glycosyltransferase family 2 protein n=1 Tax=Cohnella cholangitidis TaxID=2598458 RepID=A0A7G5BV01_9BACL|nr:glycosyltransferase family A protein [Cohnella cholangitidis]QMV40785.1 glycosyltransferase family 2 protein [Cohnella cholangitidis]
MVSIITCTMRNSFMPNVFKNYENQKVRKKELIIILNQDDMDIEEWKKEAKKYNNAFVYQLPERYNLGKCLNFGIQAANYDIVAKFDDDNYYGRYYLTEAMDALKKIEEYPSWANIRRSFISKKKKLS